MYALYFHIGLVLYLLRWRVLVATIVLRSTNHFYKFASEKRQNPRFQVIFSRATGSG